MRMLIVDDSRTMRKFLSSIAEELSFTTDQAGDGEEALVRLQESEPFDVALVDWDMPRMNGIALLSAIRAQPELDAMKIMMVTSQTSMGAVCEALTKGADDFLMKPITPQMLTEKLEILGVLAQ